VPRLLRSHLLLALLAGPACIARVPRGTPLYTAVPRPGVDQVALLAGYVARVDQREVGSLGGIFELLPGCHVIETPTKWAEGSSYGALIATTGTITFAITTQPAHRYEIVVEGDMPTGPVGPISIRARESDPTGDTVRFWGPARSRDEVEACWARRPVP
jgi:hypothetical protein